MPRIRLVIEYDGTAYVGWQRQDNGVSVQETLEKELFKLTGEKTALHGSGRTDSGVHALGQVAHFDTVCRIPPDKFAYALNTGLPADIRVRYSGEAPQDFHARFSAKRKQYRYCVLSAPHASAIERNTTLHIHYRLDIGAMNEAASEALGTHDFAAFMAAGRPVKDTRRTIYRSEWRRSGSRLDYVIEGNGFLYNMVRILAGTMLDIGMGRLAPDVMRKALESGDRGDAGPTAPAHALTLVRVIYDDFDSGEYILQ